MEINQVFENDILEIQIQGQLDANSSIQLDNVIKDAMKHRKLKMAINCQGLTYISSAGLGVFISHLDDLNGFGGKFVFYEMNQDVFNIFKILGLHTVLEIVENEHAAKMLMNES